MLPDKNDNQLKLAGINNYTGSFRSINSAIRLYNRLCSIEIITKENRKCDYKKLNEKITKENKKIRESYKNYKDNIIVANLLLRYPKKDKTDEFISMLVAAKERKPGWKRYFSYDLARVFIAVAYPTTEVKLRLEESRKVDLIFERKTQIERVSDSCLGRALEYFDMQQILKKRHPTAKSLFTNNPVFISNLGNYLKISPNLKNAYIVVPDVLDREDFFNIAEDRGINRDELRQQYERIEYHLEKTQREYRDRISINIQYNKAVFSRDEVLIITNLDWNTGDYKYCISATAIKALYEVDCHCRIYNEPDGYIQDAVNNAIADWKEREF